MSATTVFGQVRSDQASTHSKRNAAIALTVIALFALSFFVGRATASSHVSSSAQVATRQLSPADRAIVAGEVAPLNNVGTTQQLTPADRAIVAGEVAPITPTYVEVAPNGEQLAPANRALIAGEVAPITPTYVEVAPNGEQPVPANPGLSQQLSQANSASCVAGRPC
jgi:hypothetical protein